MREIFEWAPRSDIASTSSKGERSSAVSSHCVESRTEIRKRPLGPRDAADLCEGGDKPGEVSNFNGAAGLAES
jgi:hypothetical protein